MEMEYTTSGFQMMRTLSDCGSSATNGSEEDMLIRKGPWTEEEDSVLANYITTHGEGHWNSVARSAGLKRTGKSCRLRWLNYLRPNVRRGNITLQEQLMILDLHSRWGNRWSKIAEQLPGRTDNEIKNYWRTRVVKQAKQLKCDVNSKQFRDTLRYVWMPRLMEQIEASRGNSPSYNNQTQTTTTLSNAQARSEPACVTNPTTTFSLASSYSSSGLHAQTSSLSADSCVSCYNVIGDSVEKGATSTPSLTQRVHQSETRAFEYEIGFGGADFWTDENICFLQQQLADDL